MTHSSASAHRHASGRRLRTPSSDVGGRANPGRGEGWTGPLRGPGMSLLRRYCAAERRAPNWERALPSPSPSPGALDPHEESIRPWKSSGARSPSPRSCGIRTTGAATWPGEGTCWINGSDRWSPEPWPAGHRPWAATCTRARTATSSAWSPTAARRPSAPRVAPRARTPGATSCSAISSMSTTDTWCSRSRKSSGT